MKQLRASIWTVLAALVPLFAAGCDQETADLVREVEAARAECDRQGLKESSEECIQMMERYAEMGSEAIETYIGAVKSLDQALRRMPPMQFDTAGLGRVITLDPEERGITGSGDASASWRSDARTQSGWGESDPEAMPYYPDGAGQRRNDSRSYPGPYSGRYLDRHPEQSGGYSGPYGGSPQNRYPLGYPDSYPNQYPNDGYLPERYYDDPRRHGDGYGDVGPLDWRYECEEAWRAEEQRGDGSRHDDIRRSRAGEGRERGIPDECYEAGYWRSERDGDDLPAGGSGQQQSPGRGLLLPPDQRLRRPWLDGADGSASRRGDASSPRRSSSPTGTRPRR